MMISLFFSSQKFLKVSYAKPKFLTDYDITYEIFSDGETQITQNVTFTNILKDESVSSYTMILKQLRAYDVTGEDENGEINVSVEEENGETVLRAPFDYSVIGEGRQKKLSLKYKTKDIAVKIGEIWNINIPRTQISDSTIIYNIVLKVPNEMGPELFVSPTPVIQNEENGKRIYSFTKEVLKESSITAAFGQYQVLNFTLKYQLENPNVLSSTYEIALPPDIKNVQQVSYSEITPKPINIKIDSDSNFIASYKLKSKEKLEVQLKGSVRITGKQINPDFGGNKGDISSELIKNYTKEQKFWESESESISSLADSLYDPSLNVSKNAQKVYEYLVNNYSYDFDINKQDFVDRRGAKEALIRQNSLGCMEFTDLFIATTRSMGIPAREINGFALAGSDNLRPLTISFNSKDLLHSWAEYYDPNFGWVQVDPTWGSTSGLDYFTKLDTNHVTFTIKGLNSEYPLPAGAYRFDGDQKLVEVEYAQNPNEISFEPELKLLKAYDTNIFQLLKGNKRFKLINDGNTFIYLSKTRYLPPDQKTTIFLPKGSNLVTFSDFTGKIYTKNVEIIELGYFSLSLF